MQDSGTLARVRLTSLKNAAQSHSFAAVFERLANRGSTAVVGIEMVFFAAPSAVGLYATIQLVYTLAQTAGDYAVRQVAAPFWRQRGGDLVVRRTARVCAVLTAIPVALVGITLGLVGRANFEQSSLLTAYSVAGAFSALALVRITYAQAQGNWQLLARRQTIASVISLVVGCAVVPMAGIGGGLAQTTINELAFFLLLPKPKSFLGTAEAIIDPYRRVVHMSASNLISWFQGQSERVTVSIFSGPTTLGYYSVAYQIARSLVDPAGTGLVSLLRNRLVDDPRKQREIFNSSVLRAAVIGLAIQVLTVVFFILPISLFLPKNWEVSVRAAAIMSASLPLLVALWSLSALLVVRGQTSRMFPLQLLGVGLSVSAGVALTVNLWFGMMCLVVRDVVAIIGRAYLTRRDLSRSLILGLTGSFAVGCLVACLAYLMSTWLTRL